MLTMAFVARITLALVFIAAAMGKLREPAVVAEAVREFGVVPERRVHTVTRWLPRVELGCGLLLTAGLFLRPVAVLVGVLLIGFTVVLVRSLLTGQRIDCGCFGTASRRRATWWTVVRNGALLLGATSLLNSPVMVLSVDSWRTSTSAAMTNSDAMAMIIATTATLLAASLAMELMRLRRNQRGESA